MVTGILIVVATAFWLSIMLVAIALPINIKVIQITKPFICPPGSRLEVQMIKANDHRPGERGLVVLCHGPDGPQDVKNKSLTALWGISFLISLVICSLVALLWGDQIFQLLFS